MLTLPLLFLLLSAVLSSSSPALVVITWFLSFLHFLTSFCSSTNKPAPHPPPTHTPLGHDHRQASICHRPHLCFFLYRIICCLLFHREWWRCYLVACNSDAAPHPVFHVLLRGGDGCTTRFAEIVSAELHCHYREMALQNWLRFMSSTECKCARLRKP